MSLGKGLHSLIAPGSGEEKKEVVPPPREFPVTPKRHIPEQTFRREETYRPVVREKNHQRGESVFHIEVEKIVPNPYQPRKIFNEEEIRELADSIKEFGLIQPLVVSKTVKETPIGTAVEYQLLAGERRLRASKMAGLERVPAIIRGTESPKRKLELALIENIQRSDLNPLESARAYARLQDEFGLTQKEVAVRVGKSRESVANTMRLLSLSPRMQAALEEGVLNESQARHLLSIENPMEREEMFARLLSGDVSVRKMREKITAAKNPDPESTYWQRRIEEKMGLPVNISKKGTRGKVTIQFYSDEEFRSLLERLGGGEME